MAQHYEVKAGEALVVNGPANIIVKTGDVPVVGEAQAPELTALEPDTAVAGDAADIQMFVTGTGFNALTTIVFSGVDEPTSFHDATRVSTIVKPSIFTVPADVPVYVRNGSVMSAPATFSFTEAGATRRKR